ncbi:MAG TPA: glycosyltransferase family 4 protein [Acidimicrobiales bacterium]|jgi:glycosyltransferase involved in cell wall biosynthesis|nr:glycosyltransferase family 4 protein [Acidimicrobiales bacterium]
MPTAVRRIDQFVPSYVLHDAIGNHVTQLRRLLRDAGYESDIWYEHLDPRMAGDVRSYTECDPAPDPNRLILYHASTHSEMADWIMTAGAAGQRIAVDYHNITPASYFSSWEPKAARSMEEARRQLAALAPLFRGAVADSEYNALELAEFGIMGATACPILLDTSEYHAPPDPDGATRWPGDPLWLFVGRVAPNKCQHDVIAAFAVYRRLYAPAARLAVIGAVTSARYKKQLSAMVDDLGLAGAVDLAGSTPFPELLAAFGRADVFVCLSEHEGFCVPVIEAMELGVPVVAYSAAAVTETVADAGVLLGDKDPLVVAAAVNELLSDRDRTQTMIERGRARASGFSFDQTSKRWLIEIDRLATA